MKNNTLQHLSLEYSRIGDDSLESKYYIMYMQQNMLLI